MNQAEKNTVSLMIRLWCRKKHGTTGELCQECHALETFAHRRLENCVFGQLKPSCRRCAVHCYPPKRREDIRRVMRFAGGRMLLASPLASLAHLWKELIRKQPRKPQGS